MARFYAPWSSQVWFFFALAGAIALPHVSLAQAQEPAEGHLQLPLDGRDGRQLLLENFRPKPMLKVAETRLERAKFPVIDVHTHFGIRLRHSPEQRDAFVKVMDRNNIALCVSLDGGLGDKLEEHLKYLAPHADRFAVFANIDWQGDGKADDPATWDMHRPDFPRRTAMQLKEAKERGAVGLKIFKNFGLELKNPDGSLVRIDDERWDPIWQACGELGFPVLIHTADPAAFFEPIDETNERWEELHRRPEWSFYGPQFPKREELVAALMRVVERHPQTKFIAAHVANYAEDLGQASAWLDRYPNLYFEFASRIAELGRQPYTARKFLTKYADRILFGTDGPWPEERLRYYWRFLETEDENFRYSEKEFPPQGLWNIFGVKLDDETLRKIYHQNAIRLMPALGEKLRRQRVGKNLVEPSK
jgi:predicted TIM-barrel fold metal-dependent hydrolase